MITHQATTIFIISLTPVGALGLWLLFSAQPVQAKLMRPLLRALLRVKLLRRRLTLPVAPGW